MLHDPVRVSETRAWLGKAANDLRAAENGLVASPPLLEDVVFHCQQATEKTLKGFLLWNGCPFRKTHSIEELGEACLRVDPALRPLIDEAVPLTQYAWEFRYPGEPEMPSSEESEAALSVARTLYQTILGKLPKDAHP
ncbi:MAG: HEPN domain-containing protein [Candidatus Lindowbacteria bacterium]|nr:HEPN domain-containing protein [Candidatus Lindowbacteria bacterium]